MTIRCYSFAVGHAQAAGTGLQDRKCKQQALRIMWNIRCSNAASSCANAAAMLQAAAIIVQASPAARTLQLCYKQLQ